MHIAPRRILSAFAVAAVTTGLLVACTSPMEPDAQPASATLQTLASGDSLNAPSDIAPRPGTSELWVTNRGTDTITVIDTEGDADATGLRDAYGEHFTARPSGIAFSEDGEFFAVSNDSNNELRGMSFTLNPERNTHFKGNNFMGPTLFATQTFSLAGQSKEYLDDWPQPGIAHDSPDDTPQAQCPSDYWNSATARCVWPRQGSHIDMLHGNPLSTGIVHDEANAYFLLDGCGARDADEVCVGPGHVSYVDFNRDHQEGNGFHGDGTTKRYIDLPYTRVDELPSGMFIHDGWVYYADTGAGVVRRFQPDSGTSHVMVSNWNGSPASHGEHGTGVTDWSHIEHGPGDGDEPATIAKWVEEFGDHEAIAAAADDWIAPMETLAEYSYVRGATQEEATDGLTRPTGIAAGTDSWFVADNATGRIHEFGWDGSVVRVIETDKPSLTGLALAPSGRELYITDSVSNAVFSLNLG